jgi:hypothetical protein
VRGGGNDANRNQRARTKRQDRHQPGLLPFVKAQIDGIEKEDESETDDPDDLQCLIVDIDLQYAQPSTAKRQANPEEDDRHGQGRLPDEAGHQAGEHQHHGDEHERDDQLVHAHKCRRLACVLSASLEGERPTPPNLDRQLSRDGGSLQPARQRANGNRQSMLRLCEIRKAAARAAIACGIVTAVVPTAMLALGATAWSRSSLAAPLTLATAAVIAAHAIRLATELLGGSDTTVRSRLRNAAAGGAHFPTHKTAAPRDNPVVVDGAVRVLRRTFMACTIVALEAELLLLALLLAALALLLRQAADGIDHRREE